jgi:uncharacterized protein YbgA (DUF1722 family)
MGSEYFIEKIEQNDEKNISACARNKIMNGKVPVNNTIYLLVHWLNQYKIGQ